MSHPGYEYRVFPARLFVEVCGGVRFPGAYLSADAETQALQLALAKGYRLHTLTAEYAVFERITNEPQD